MILGHTIALDPTSEQEAYFRRACGTARFAYNWALAEWKRMHAGGEKPSTSTIKARWNAYRAAELAWSYEVTKCASGQAILDLGTAFANFFRDCQKPRKLRGFLYPRFKKKQVNESFGLWNDQFDVDWDRIRIPRLGWVRMREHLRLCGVILGATVSFSGGRWFVSVQVDAESDKEPPPVDTVVGVDLGVETLATLSTGEKIEGPKPRKRLLGRIKRLQRRVGLQKHRAKKAGQKASHRQLIRQLRLSRMHARVANIRKDATHKLTTDLALRFETVVIEDLNISGMSKNHALAGAVLDGGWHEIRRQLQYKTAMRDGRVVVADRFFPSSKVCSACGCVKDAMPLSVRGWTCDDCGTTHDRDVNAAKNLEKLGLAKAEVTRGDMMPLLAGASLPASVVIEPRT